MNLREQYTLAWRLLRLELVQGAQSWYVQRVFQSFGICTIVLDKAMTSYFDQHYPVDGWVNLERKFEFEERRDGSWCETYIFSTERKPE